ncbi:MAG: hypothetical protein ABI585_06500 [Betaproteobacteria bacterium]
MLARLASGALGLRIAVLRAETCNAIGVPGLTDLPVAFNSLASSSQGGGAADAPTRPAGTGPIGVRVGSWIAIAGLSNIVAVVAAARTKGITMAEKSPGHTGSLDAAFVSRQKARLETLRDELLQSDRSALAAERQLREDNGEEAREFEDDAQDMARQEVQLALHDVDRRRLSSIARALDKIAEGTYGLSDASGTAIPRARLEAMPEATRTVDEEQGG